MLSFFQELVCVRVVRPSKLASCSSLYELRLDTGVPDPYMEGRYACVRACVRA